MVADSLGRLLEVPTSVGVQMVTILLPLGELVALVDVSLGSAVVDDVALVKSDVAVSLE